MKKLADRVLAIHPNTTGFGWMVFDGSGTPVDWGVAKSGDRSNKGVLARIDALMTRTVATELVMEDAEAEGSKRHDRIRRLYRAVLKLADTRSIDTTVYSRADINACFVDATESTRYEIAVAIAKRFPDFEHLLPPRRKIWLPEDPAMGLFDAAAVAITHYWMAPKS